MDPILRDLLITLGVTAVAEGVFIFMKMGLFCAVTPAVAVVVMVVIIMVRLGCFSGFHLPSVGQKQSKKK